MAAKILRNIFIAGLVLFVFISLGVLAVKKASYIREHIIQAFRIPTDTMSPTLLRGDHILVDKSIYRNTAPRRGDVIVFIGSHNPGKIYAKRVVGLPGETIEIKDGSVIIEGTPIKDGVIGNTRYYNKGNYAQEGQQIKIPDDGYFVLGDNSLSSPDSRYWGPVPRRNIIGKATFIYYPFTRIKSIEN